MRIVNSCGTTDAMKLNSKIVSEGGAVLNLTAGDPKGKELQVFENFQNFAIYWPSTVNYGPNSGFDYMKNCFHYNSSTHDILFSNGAKELIYLALMAVTKPNSEVVIIGPCWSSYVRICNILHLQYHLIVGDEKHHYVPNLGQIATAVSSKTCAIVVNNPNNPTGKVYSKNFLKMLMKIAKVNKTWVIADEIYSNYVYGRNEFISLEGEDHVITINGISKSYGFTGWRLGWAIAPQNVIQAMSDLQSQISGPVSTLAQIATHQYWLCNKPIINKSIMQERVDCLCQSDNFARYKPDGGFYFYLPIDKAWENSTELCQFLFTTYKIALTPGDEYGVNHTVRVSIAAEEIDKLDKYRKYLEFIFDKNAEVD